MTSWVQTAVTVAAATRVKVKPMTMPMLEMGMKMRAGMMSLWFIVLSPCMTRAQNTMERIE